jgi:hypothetical protein
VDGGGDKGRVVGELAPGQAEDLVARVLEVQVLGAVALEYAASSVPAPAVQLDNEALLGPVGVDIDPLDEHVRLRFGEVVVAAEIEEVALPIGASIWGASVIGNEGNQLAEASMAVASADEPVEHAEVEELLAVG